MPITAIHADISRIIKYAPVELIGREAETNLLSDAWDKAVHGEAKRPHVLTFVALGGEGKTSLVAKWAADLAFQNWPGCDAVFAWSFYSQGTREQTAASSDLFLKEALTVFGDPAMAGSAQGAFDKGRRLAQLVGERRALLILDGVEPLQYPPTSPTPGELKDAGIAALLKGLAATSHGLCIVTTRYAISDLRAYWQTTAPMHDLPPLSRAAGVELLQSIGVTGSLRNVFPGADGGELLNEFEKLVEDVDGHALTLQIVGQFLVRAFHGDIRRRDRVGFEKANERFERGHAFRAMEAYVKWMEDDSEEARREVAVLKLLGLFDRPATANLLAALRQPPAIPGLTEPLVGLAEDDWEFSFTGLRGAKLLTVNRDPGSGELAALDAHPLLRECFGRRLRQQQPDAWRAAHRRLYEHLRSTTNEGDQPTLEDLQPLYQAVAHGCQAGLQQETFGEVYMARILRGSEYYSSKRLGALGADLGAVACFFEQPWSRVSPLLTEAAQSWLLNQAAVRLRALGRLTEALKPMQLSVEMDVKVDEWTGAAISARELSLLDSSLGDLKSAMRDAEQSVIYADRSGDAFESMGERCIYADALHQSGRRAEAEACFCEAEGMQAKNQPDAPLLYSLQGFKYCDLLLAGSERAVWTTLLACGDLSAFFNVGELPPSETRQLPSRESGDKSSHCKLLREISQRAAQTLNWLEASSGPLLDIALDHLTLGRAKLFEAILDGSSLNPCHVSLQHSMDGLRRASSQDHIPRGLLTRAWLRSLTGGRTGPESAQADLDEAWEIAERGPMRLHMADIHLYRARLFHVVNPYPWTSPHEDLAEARKLIEQCGYWRRKEELEDAEAAAKN